MNRTILDSSLDSRIVGSSYLRTILGPYGKSYKPPPVKYLLFSMTLRIIFGPHGKSYNPPVKYLLFSMA